MKTIGTGGIAGGPVDAGPVDLPMEPRTTDLDAYRARIEAKRQQRRTQISTLLLAGRHTPTTTPPPPVPEPDDEPAEDEEPLVWDRDEDDDEPTPADDARQPDDDEPALAEQDADPAPPSRRGRPVRVLTADEVERVVTAYVAGQGITTIARDTHLGVERIKAVLRDAGVELRPLGREGQRIAAQQRGEDVPTRRRAAPPTAEAVARMASAYYRGDSLAAIAQREHINRDRLRDALVAAGVKIREKGKRPAEAVSAQADAAPAGPRIEWTTDGTSWTPVGCADSMGDGLRIDSCKVDSVGSSSLPDASEHVPDEQGSVEAVVLAGVPPLLAAEAIATVALDREDGTQVLADYQEVETGFGYLRPREVPEVAWIEWPAAADHAIDDLLPKRARHRADVEHAAPPGDFLLALAAFIRDAEHLLEQGRRLQASLEPTPTKEPTA